MEDEDGGGDVDMLGALPAQSIQTHISLQLLCGSAGGRPAVKALVGCMCLRQLFFVWTDCCLTVYGLGAIGRSSALIRQ